MDFMSEHVNSLCSVRLILLENAYSYALFQQAILTPEVGKTDDLVFGRDQCILGLYVQDYKCLSAMVTICSILVNIQTETYQQTAF